MAGYRCVNFSDLCRLCSNAASNNVQIYSEEGLQKKIIECVSISLNEKDKLPKIICSSCHEYIEIFYEFRKACSNAQKMLESCINTTKLRNGGQVYIKDEVPAKKVLKPIQNPSPTKLLPNLNLCNIIATTPTKQIKKPTAATPSQQDLISSIMQAVGIPSREEGTEVNVSQPNIQQSTIQSLPQYTLTIDGNTLKSGQIQYKIENAGNILSTAQANHQILTKNVQDVQVDEFLKLKKAPSLVVKKDSTTNSLSLAALEEPKDKKPKFNLILQTTSQKQQPKVQQPQIISPNSKAPTLTSPNKPQILNIEKLLPNQMTPKQVVVPIMMRKEMVKDGTDTAAQIIQQALSMSTNQIDNKTVTNQPFAYVQMKIQPNADGQFTLAPAHSTPQPLQLSLSPQQIQQLNFQTAPHSQQILAVQQQQQPQQQQQIPQVTAQETQTQPQASPIKTEDSSDEMYNENFDDDDYYQMDDSESLVNEVQEKSTSSMEKKSSAKKAGKTVKTLKVKPKPSAESLSLNSTSINEEHSDMAKKQLDQLTSFNCKRAEAENAEKSGEINLTVCDVCKKIFKRKEFLMQHLKSHIGLRPFKCEEGGCNKSFSRKEHLLRHVSSHTGRKEFTCNICNKLFSRKDNLNKHKRIHPESGQNVRNNCSNCDKGFANRAQLTKHQLVCDGKEAERNENVKETKNASSPVTKKVKIKPEKKPENTESVKTTPIVHQEPKLVQVIQQQQSHQTIVKAENQPQQIILSMSQAQAMLSQKAVYTFPTNIILNSNGTFMSNISGSEMGSLKFDTQ